MSFDAALNRSRVFVLSLCILGLPDLTAMPIFDNGGYSGDQIARYNGGFWTIYEDFTLTTSATVDGLFWQQHDTSSVVYTTTTITFFDGTPSAASLFATYTLAATRTPNGLPVLVDMFYGYDYSVSGLNLPLSAGTYYFGIHNDGDTEAAMTWDETEGSASSIQGRWQTYEPPDAGEFFSAEDSVFQILGASSGPSEVPEQGTFFILACGLAGIAVLRLRRR